MSTSTAADPLTVRTTPGVLHGSTRDGVRRWMGIPYAEPPVGDLRWRAPRPARPWRGVRDATTPGAAEPQVPNPFTGGIGRRVPQSEDCLTLNVFAPEHADDLPVMVWIHGGAYRSGAGGIPEYDGTRLAQLGVVVVTISYRLGVFGSMDLTSVVDSDANCTMRDQIAALEWVRDEIRAFGGDPGRITIAGESSGGNAVTTLLAAPATHGIVAGAIAQSPHPMTSHTPAKKAEHAVALAERLGLDPATTDRTALGRAMRAVPAPRLQAVAAELDDDVTRVTPLVAVFSPTIDGDVLPEHPLAAAHAGRNAQVPLVIGTNRDEESIFRHARTPILPNTEDRVRLLVEGTDPAAWDRIRAVYADGARDWSGAGVDGVFHVPSTEFAEAHAAAGNPVWMYRYDHASPLMRAAGLGAAHGTELPYLFGAFRTPIGRIVAGTDLPRVRRRLHDVLAGSWTAFVRDGAPSHRGWSWPRYEESSRSVLSIDTVSRVLHDPHPEVRRAWTGVTYDY
ncbi:MAG: carboxylesterase/lipase family protein [Williamsia herbipolensis]|nr:carboxylesterase/lipase family protein [Williamsia herbipolensis]